MNAQLSRLDTVYLVKYCMEFVSGSLEGLFHDSELSFHSLEDANHFMNFLHAHKEVPVEPIQGNSAYIFHLARIVVI